MEVPLRGASRLSAGLALLSTAFSLISCTPAPHPSELLLLITVDTLRADRLGAYGSDRELTPYLDAFAQESLRFTSAYATAAITLPSIAAILTGRYPESIGMRSNASVLPADVPTLATTLQSRGWRTGAVVSNLVLQSDSGLANGFDVYDDAMTQREAVREWPERIATDTTNAALRVFDELIAADQRTGTKVFLWVHYQDPHGPYTPPPGLREEQLAAELLVEDGSRELPVQRGAAQLGALPTYQQIDGRTDVAFYRAGYAAEVNYFDREFGRLWSELGAREVLDSAVTVFTADHGESLGEGDFWFAHGEYLSEALVRVPLLFRGPGFVAGIRDEPVSLVDLWPTLLNRLAPGASGEPEATGRDLRSPAAFGKQSTPYLATLGGSRTPRVGVVFGDYKLVATRVGGRWREQLFRRGRSPGEPATPLAAPPLALELRVELARLRRLHATSRAEVRQALTEGDRQKLRALGYVFEP